MLAYVPVILAVGLFIPFFSIEKTCSVQSGSGLPGGT